MGSAFFGSAEANAFSDLGSDAITVTRRDSPTGGNWTITTVYSGPGDLQEGAGSTYYGPAGAVEVSDAILVLSADDEADLPAVEVGDTVTRTSDGKTFTVSSVSKRVSLLPHLEIALKRGGLPMKQGGGHA